MQRRKNILLLLPCIIALSLAGGCAPAPSSIRQLAVKLDANTESEAYRSCLDQYPEGPSGKFGLSAAASTNVGSVYPLLDPSSKKEFESLFPDAPSGESAALCLFQTEPSKSAPTGEVLVVIVPNAGSSMIIGAR